MAKTGSTANRNQFSSPCLTDKVTLVDLSYNLEYLFNTNSEIGTFEMRYLPRQKKKHIVALDFLSGFDAIAAQEQLDGYRYEMPEGAQYILRAKITNKKEYLRSDSSPESSRRRSRSPSTEDEAWLAMAAASLPSMSDAEMLRANAKLDAKYKLLQKQKLIVKSEMELIRERRKLRREYAQADKSESDEEALSSRKPGSSLGEHRSWSQELELFKIKLTDKIQQLKGRECRLKESASSRRKSPSWDKSRSLERVKSKPNSRERSLRIYRSGSRVRSRRSRSWSRSPPHESKSRERCPKYKKSRVLSRAIRSRSFSRSPRNSKSRSRTPSPRAGRSWSRARRSCGRRSCSRDADSRDKKIERSHNRSSYKRLRSPDAGSRSKRLRSPDSGYRGRRSRSRGRLLAIMPKSPVKEAPFPRSKITRWSTANNSECNMTTMKNINKRAYSPEHSENHKSKSLSGHTDIETKTGAKNLSDLKTKSNLPKNNCTMTSVTIKSNAIEKQPNLNQSTINEKKENISLPSGTKAYDHVYKKENSEVDDVNDIGSNDSSQNADEELSKDTQNNTESTEREHAKNNDQTKMNIDADARKVKNKDIMIQSICDDIMSMMQSLLLEISTKENITLSESNATAMEDTLHVLVQQRVNILYVEKHISILNATENYRKICTKEDDTLLLKRMLDELKTLEADSTLSQTSVPSKDRPIPACPRFVLIIKKLMKQLKPVMARSRQQGVYVNYFHMKQVLWFILRDILKGEGYKNSSEILTLFRQKYPKNNDDEFVKKVAEDINMKKYDLEGATDKERQDNDDVILLENEHEVVVISDDEGDECRENIINKLNEFTENENLDGTINYNDFSEIEKVVEAFSITEPETNVLKETDIIASNDSETGNVAFKNIIQTKESEKINATVNSIVEEAEKCNTIIKQEEQQRSETVQNQDYRADVNTVHMCSKELNVKKTECDRNKEEKSHESLKVTAITIMTSETELHSIANAIGNGSVDGPKENIKEEIESELTDAELDKILSIDNFNLDLLSAIDACEKETPQLISVTITTSASELFSLKYEGVENASKEVPEVKTETIENIKNEIQADENMENAALSVANGGVSNITNAEMLCPQLQDKRRMEDEDETIESISKYLTSICNDL